MRDFCVITIVFCVGIDVRMKNRDKGMEIRVRTSRTQMLIDVEGL